MLGRVGVWSFALQTHGADEEREAVRSYEAAGFRAVWYPESVGSKEAFTHAAILLSASPSIVVASGIANIYARDAMAMMNGARTLAEATGGRFVLGVGVSHAPSVATRGGVYEQPIEHMSTYLDAMEAAGYAGPAAARPVPLVLAALGPRMLELAAARTDGAHTYFVPVAHTAPARDRIGDAVLVVEQTAVIGTDAEAGRRVARAFAEHYLELPNYANNLRRLGWSDADLASGGSDRLIGAVVAHGDAGTIVRRVRDHLEAGADHVCVQLRAADPTDPCVGGFAELGAALRELMTSARRPSGSSAPNG
jgi:probable F420-dependent oxidoreductase